MGKNTTRSWSRGASIRLQEADDSKAKKEWRLFGLIGDLTPGTVGVRVRGVCGSPRCERLARKVYQPTSARSKQVWPERCPETRLRRFVWIRLALSGAQRTNGAGEGLGVAEDSPSNPRVAVGHGACRTRRASESHGGTSRSLRRQEEASDRAGSQRLNARPRDGWTRVRAEGGAKC